MGQMKYPMPAFKLSQLLLATLALILCAIGLSLITASYTVGIIEPYRNWNEMSMQAWRDTVGAFRIWILLFALSILVLSLWCRDGKSWQDVIERGFVVIRLFLSGCILTVFGIGQMAITARQRVDLLEGVPDHLLNGRYDLLASPFWLAILILVWIPWPFLRRRLI
jgi:hypothetical protein